MQHGFRRQDAASPSADKDDLSLRAQRQHDASDVRYGRVLAEVLFAPQGLQSFLGPERGGGQQVGHDMPRRTFLGRVFQQLLVVYLPAELLADALANRAA